MFNVTMYVQNYFVLLFKYRISEVKIVPIHTIAINLCLNHVFCQMILVYQCLNFAFKISEDFTRDTYENNYNALFYHASMRHNLSQCSQISLCCSYTLNTVMEIDNEAKLLNQDSIGQIQKTLLGITLFLMKQCTYSKRTLLTSRFPSPPFYQKNE